MRKIILFYLVIAVVFLSSCSNRVPQNPEDVYSKYKNEETLEGKIKIYENFRETNPESDLIRTMLYNIVNRINQEKGIIEASDYLMDNEENASFAIYNSLAWQIYESGENLELGAALARTGVEKAREKLTRIKETKPENLSLEEWEKATKQNLAMVLDTYGCIERKLNNNAEALLSCREAVKLMDAEDAEVNENYVSALIKQNEIKEAKISLEKFISSGNDTENMKDQLKDVFTKTGNSEAEFELYLFELKEKAREKMIERLKREIKNEPAKDFELYDLDGKIVKLSDFKGKTVILDFWATWCSPCLKSFP